jgi:pyruvate,orthophosphate dikinase
VGDTDLRFILPGMPSSGILPGVPSSGILPGMPSSGILPGVPSSGILPGVPSSGILPGVPSSGMPGMRLSEADAALVGNKAWNLMRLAEAGLPVPPGFVLPTTWSQTRRSTAADDAALSAALSAGIARLEAATGLGFGSARRPLLVSVRSGAAISMPGMLETVLDVGLNARTVDGLMRLTGNPRLAWDSYRRLVQGYAEVVADLPAEPFEAATREAIRAEGVDNERELDFRALRALTGTMLERFEAAAGRPFPADPLVQLTEAAAAVFRSWDAPKAVAYRRLKGLDDEAGTAVTVQMMVFGNTGGDSGAGVGFTRDPATGENLLYFDFCFNGQGEDVVAGRRTLTDNAHLRQRLPLTYAALLAARGRLEALFGDMQDFEFTVQAGQLYLLQTRRGQRTANAALRIAVDMVAEGLIPPAEALARLATIDLSGLGQTRFSPPLPEPLAQATVAGSGVVSGPIALDSTAAERLGRTGPKAILVRPDTATADIAGMAAAAGLLTGSGSRTSHAAVVARQLGLTCLVGCGALVIDLARRSCRIGGHTLAEGEAISLDGNGGFVYPGTLPVVFERPDRELTTVAAWRQEQAAVASAPG